MGAISMTGAGRLSSGPQPVMANAARVCLSCRSIARGPRRRGISLLAAAPVGDGSPKGENPAKLGFQRQPTARSRRETALCSRKARYEHAGLDSRQLDVLASLCLRVIDSDLEHGKTLLQLFRARLGTIPRRKFSLESAVDFERIT